MTIQDFKNRLEANPLKITFSETMQVIEANYHFIPTSFANGDIKNEVGENSGSCKLFAFAMHQKLTKEEALFCFGEHYQSVLNDANGTSHQNIRNFMKTGFEGLDYQGEVLTLIT
ncbi:HopJ type III effector protein [Polaribacter porphyrae]|uniref:Type III effector n=1 Tax=Polaribacter porphyrae TaxID=1137780 RepID=A0A2S7WRN8_9FLAO|nr:HopJ type III effector protein [Polaribacter porphyrae]PQJ80259.1 type III effector [Polaribacter porphyrae]